MAKTAKPTFTVEHDYYHSETDNNIRDEVVISLSAGEVYESGEYYEKGKYLPTNFIDLFIELGVLKTT